MIAFSIPIIPKAQARARAGLTHGGKPVMFTGSGQRQAQNDLIALMAPYAPQRPLEGPLSLEVGVRLPIPQSWPKKKQAAALAHELRPTGKPDLDNYVKQAMDCMTKLSFWGDDSQVVFISAGKEYAAKPHWYIKLLEAGDEARRAIEEYLK